MVNFRSPQNRRFQPSQQTSVNPPSPLKPAIFLQDQMSIKDDVNLRASQKQIQEFKSNSNQLNVYPARKSLIWKYKENKRIFSQYRKAKILNQQKSYQIWVQLTQIIDLSILSYENLKYENRILAAAFIYLFTSTKMEYWNPKSRSQFWQQNCFNTNENNEKQFNMFFSEFLEASVQLTLEQILPAIQQCTIFFILKTEEKQIKFQKTKEEGEDEIELGIQVCNTKSLKTCRKIKEYKR